MTKHLIFDIQVIIDLWLKTGSAAVTEHLFATVEDNNGTRAWMTSTSLVLLEIAARQELERQGWSAQDAARSTSQHLTQWLTRIEILTVHGFEQANLYHTATCFQDAQIAAAARSLPGQQVCIVTENAQFDNLGEIPCKTPAQALIWLTQSEPAERILASVPFIDLATQQAAVRPALERHLEQVLRHGQYILGTEVRELEARLAEYTGAAHCITVASGTDALLVSLMALGIGPGDEVITTSFTFIATAEVIALVGAKPVFVDIDPETCNLNPHLLEAKITAQTKAIIPVSLYGQPAEMATINAIADRHGLPVIEDAAQSFGAMYKGRKSCNLSTIGCTSFFPSKPLGCYGDGGAIFTNDDAIAQACRELRIHGQSQRYLHTKIGICSRMDTLQCAVVLAKLTRFTWEVEQRQTVAARYQQALGVDFSSQVIRPLPWPQADRTSVFAQYTILTQHREALQAKLQQAGIPTAVHYPLSLTDQPAYRHFSSTGTGAIPVATAIAQQVLSLPMGPDLKIVDQARIVRCIKDASCNF